MTKIEQLKKSFGSEDYVYEGKDCSCKTIKYKYKCPVGHHHSIRMNHWNNGVRCQ